MVSSRFLECHTRSNLEGCYWACTASFSDKGCQEQSGIDVGSSVSGLTNQDDISPQPSGEATCIMSARSEGEIHYLLCRRVCANGSIAAYEGLPEHCPALPDWACVHGVPLQFPPQPGRPQDRASSGCRVRHLQAILGSMTVAWTGCCAPSCCVSSAECADPPKSMRSDALWPELCLS